MSDNMTSPLDGDSALSLRGGVKALQQRRSAEQEEVSEAGRTLAKAKAQKAEESASQPEEEPVEAEVSEETVEAETEEPEVEEQEAEHVEETETDVETEDQEEVEEANGVLLTLDDGTPLTADEIRKSYLREADYTRKTQKLATERRAVEAEAKARHSALDAALASVKPEPEPDWEAVSRSDPDWQIKKLQFDKRNQERQNAIAILKQEQQSVLQRSKENAVADLQSGVYRKDWKSNDVMNKDLQATSVFAAERLGFGLQELDNIADPRAIMALDMARRFADTQGKVQTAKKKVVNKPKVIKPGVKTGLKSGLQRGVSAAQQAFDKSPTRDNAKALMKAKREAQNRST